jgi:4-amino-4-deoxy-L-arabinose transferase-like glycosyltransferase
LIPFKRKAAFACAFLLLIDLIVYLLTRAPVVQFIDSGELAVVCQTLGIAHPTGYPLYTLLGRLFCLIPLQDVIFRVNLMSLLFTCLSSVILFLALLIIGRDFLQGTDGRSRFVIWAALLASLIFSFTPTMWSQATSNEVYSLNVLFYTLIILLVLLWRTRRKPQAGERISFLLAFVYGLSFGNHMSTVLLLPAILFISIDTLGKRLFTPRRILFILSLFLLGLSIYVFLPIRSAQNPVMDWGNPESWATFKRHVTGWQYQVWMFAQSAEELGGNLANFIKLFFHQFPIYLLPLSLVGIWRIFVCCRRILVFLLVVFLANILYGINYGIPDIDPYFLGSFLANAIFIGTGLHFVFQIIANRRIRKGLVHGILALFVLSPLILLKNHYFEANRSGDYFGQDFASNIMRSVKKDAIILTNVWDHYSPWLYLRFVELKRPDVNYLDTELCRRSWYFDYVRQSYVDLYHPSENEIKRFLKEVQPFESRLPFDPQVIERAYIGMLDSFLDKNFKGRPLYDDLIGGPKVGTAYLRIPEGMVLSLQDSLTYHPYSYPDLELRGVLDSDVFKDDRTLFNLKRYPFMIDLRLRYLSDFKQEQEANSLFRRYEPLLSRPIQ